MFHIDKTNKSKVCASAIGQKNAVKAAAHFAFSPQRVVLFPWTNFLTKLNKLGVKNSFNAIFDLADACKESMNYRVHFDQLTDAYYSILEGRKNEL